MSAHALAALSGPSSLPPRGRVWDRVCSGRPPACVKAAGTRGAPASLVPLVPRRGRGSSEMLHLSCVLLLLFSREKPNSEAVFRFFSLFCQCQSDLLCQIP